MPVYSNVLAIPAERIAEFGEWLRDDHQNPCYSCNEGAFDTKQINGVVYITNLTDDTFEALRYWMSNSFCVPCSILKGYDEDGVECTCEEWSTHDHGAYPDLSFVQGVEINL